MQNFEDPQSPNSSGSDSSTTFLSLNLAGPSPASSNTSFINRKTRKPYVITKQRENWTDEEHNKFMEALKLFDRDWKKIEAYIGTKSVIQIRSHAQKFFLKIQKNNTGEMIPPPRPKRKALQPYPQKNKEHSTQWISTQPHRIARETTPPLVQDLNTTPSSSPLQSSSFTSSPSSSFSSSPPRPSSPTETTSISSLPSSVQRNIIALACGPEILKANFGEASRGINFGKIYSFIERLFDPSTSNHVDALNEMSDLEREALQFCMHKMAVFLSLDSNDFPPPSSFQITSRNKPESFY